MILLGHLGYGTYSFETKSHLESLDKNITFGGFTYDSYGDDESIPTGPFREIDVEASRWGNAADPTNAQFVVQPFGVNGNLHRYTIEDHTNVPTLTHYLDWTPDHIEFATLNGTQDANSFPTTSIVDRLLYVNDPLQNHFIPTSSREKFRFNTWINSGGAPSDGNPVQIVIPKFQFQPSIAPIIAGPLTAIIPHSGIFAFDPSKIIAVSDKDAGISSETVSLSVTAGLLEMNTNAVSVIGGASGTKDITIRGTLDKLNASLATLKFIAPNSGSSSTLTVSANDGTLQSNVLNVAIDLTNIAPTLDAIPDPLPILEDSGPTQIVLTGISAGGNESQKLVLKADSSNPMLIPTPIVVYVSPNSAGVVSYSPLASQSGTVTIAVTVMDDGGTQAGGADRLVRTFTQRVIPVNDAPSFHKGCPNVCRAESPLGDGLAFA